MEAASVMVSEEQFRCSICLDIFTDPVSIPCGHNFCKNCISENWNVSEQCECPLCKRVFSTRLELQVNTFISEMAAQYRHSAVKKARRCSLQKTSSSGDVLCSVCSETNVKAVKSCLMCLTSYCEAHLEFHQKMIGPTQHELINPVVNLADRMCGGHGRPLEMFCTTDQTCVCLSCIESNHNFHSIVPLVRPYQQRKAELEKTAAEIQKMIKERRLKVQEMEEAVKLSREDADKEKSDSVEVFATLIRYVEEGLAQLLDLIEERQKETEKKAEGFIEELENEISLLLSRSAEVEHSLSLEDHLQFLQSFLSMNPAPTTKVWTDVKVHSSYEGTVSSAVAQLEKKFGEEVKKQLKAELEAIKQFAADITLDPDTAYSSLSLSCGGKRVQCGGKRVQGGGFSFGGSPNYQEDPRRFSKSSVVLSTQGFSSGKFYYEVDVESNTTRWELGVTLGSVNRKQEVSPSWETGPWILLWRNGSGYFALSEQSTSLPFKLRLKKVGVFVDYEEGRVSFYNADTAAHIHSFTGCEFEEKLYPYFGLNSDSLFINHVSSSDAVAGLVHSLVPGPSHVHVSQCFPSSVFGSPHPFPPCPPPHRSLPC